MKKNEIDLTSGNLFKKIFIVAIPLLVSGVLQLFYNAADLIVCGKFGSEHSVAAISSTNPLINLLCNLFLGLSIGANVVMARSYGSNNKEKCSRIVHTSMILSIIIGIGIGLVGVIFSFTFLTWMKTPEDVIHLSNQYLSIYFLGLPFSMVYNYGASLLRATGDTKRPFFFLLIAGIMNIILNLILVIVFKLDVAGVAIATITSQGISAILVVLCLMRHSGYCHLAIKQLKLHKQELKEMILVGVPAGIQGAIFSISNVLIQSSVNSLGTLVMDGNGASTSLEGFVYTSMNSIAQTGLSFISANYGAKKVKNIYRSILYTVILVTLFGIGLGGLVILFGKPLLSLYVSKNKAIIDIGYKRLIIICSTYFLCGLMDTLAYTLRGIGYSILPTIVSLCGGCGLRILWIFTVFQIPAYNNLQSLSVSYPISWLITTLVHLFLFLILKNKAFHQLKNETELKPINVRN